MPRRSRSRIDQSSLAVTIPSGEIVVGLGYCSSASNIRELAEVISTTKLKPGQRWFVGVVLDKVGRADVVRRLDDGVAEAAAMSGVGTGSNRKGAGT